MKNNALRWWTLAGYLVAAVAGVVQPLEARQRPDTVVAFVDVTVVPMDAERIVPHQTVIVRDGRIWQMGPSASTPAPAGAMRIDGTGRFLMPGLAEMHGHTAGPNATEEFKEQVMFLYAANGVTTVRGMLGIPGDLELKALTNSGRIWGPTL